MDADIVAYQACASNQTEFLSPDGDLISLTLDVQAAKDSVNSYLQNIIDQTGEEGDMIICLSDYSKDYFRKDFFPEYKANRASAGLVMGLKVIKKWMEEEFDSYIRPRLEADDVMGILATWPKFKPKHKKVIVSEDKDMVTIGGYLFNPRNHDSIQEISQEEADRFFYTQVLTGDTTDNYKGCPGIGDKTAIKILDKAEDEGIPYWDSIVATYESKGLTEDDALIQARCARILRAQDYNFKEKEAKLWMP